MTQQEKALYENLCVKQVHSQTDVLRDYAGYKLAWTDAMHEFMAQFRAHQSKEQSARQLLEEAILARDAIEVEFSLSVLTALGHFPQHVSLFAELFRQEWHHRHEDMIWGLENFGPKIQITEALLWAAGIRLDYLDYDDSAALARKAIYALGRMPGPEARNKLNSIAEHSTGLRHEWALRKLEEQARL